jgi:hypothetical protein
LLLPTRQETDGTDAGQTFYALVQELIVVHDLSFRSGSLHPEKRAELIQQLTTLAIVLVEELLQSLLDTTHLF